MANTYNPTGFNPVRYLNGVPWNNQMQTYRIKSGYGNNIFRGDPVIIGSVPAAGGTGGYLISLADFNGAGGAFGTSPYISGTSPLLGNTPIFGIFMGCSYQTTPSQNPVDFASPGRQYWPAGQTTVGNADAIANVIVDPNVVYTMQASNGGAAVTTASSNTMNYTRVGMTLSGTNVVSGSTQTGQSSAFIDTTVLSTDITSGPGVLPYNLRLLNLPLGSGVPGNADGAQYNIWEVLIENHYFAGRAAV